MPDLIHLLPDSVANQIAAGEVVQRPASVLKELLENSVDAGCTKITVIVEEAGRALVQVVDNGKGMSLTDARMAFERHATSKISKAQDLFSLNSFGFRGEALASIAAVSEVTLKTKREEDEIGTELIVTDSKVVSQNSCQCDVGSNFKVRNLFYNIPARRKFLKSNTTEFRYLLSEFQRVAIPYPNISMVLIHNNIEMLNLPSSNIKQRINHLMGKNFSQYLIDIGSETSVVKISGYIGKPESARKSYGDQFFFVNNRFMKHSGFHRAITDAYQRLIAPEDIPVYFIFFETEPSKIDINIHPTKTEIKFEDEQSIRQLLYATVKEALGKFNIVPSIDFENEVSIPIPLLNKNSVFHAPEIEVNPFFNPFDEPTNYPGKNERPNERDNLQNLHKLYGFNQEPLIENNSDQYPANTELFNNASLNQTVYLQLKGKYILSQVRSGLLIIDQKKAHEQILYESFLNRNNQSEIVSKANLFPEKIELTSKQFETFKELTEVLTGIGFDFSHLGDCTILVNAYPANMESSEVNPMLLNFFDQIEVYSNPETDILEKTARTLAKSSSIHHGTILKQEEMHDLVERLFSCNSHQYTSDGHVIMQIIDMNEIEKRFKK